MKSIRVICLSWKFQLHQKQFTKLDLMQNTRKMLSKKMETLQIVQHCLIRGTAIADNVMREQTPHFFTSKQKWVTDQRSKAQIHNMY